MTIPKELNYNIDGLMSRITSGSFMNTMGNVQSDTNKLVSYLNDTQDGFHDKGNDNVMFDVYDEFADFIGSSKFNKNGMMSLLQETEDVLNMCYDRAVSDKEQIRQLEEEERRRLEAEANQNN